MDNTQNMSRLCLITALSAETRPLLDALKLRQMQAGHLRVYGADSILLLETGPGKLNAAACTAAMLQHYPEVSAVMNIGIAGGRFDYAQAVLAHHIKDQSSGAQWYPHIPGSPVFRAVPSASICTVDVPETNYAHGMLYDMEAAGIFIASARCLSTSQIHSVKVVSDNPEYGLEHINKQTVNSLIHEAIPTIKPLIAVMLERCANQEQHQANLVESYVESVCKSIKHSVNDKQLLRRLVQQHVGRTGELPNVHDMTVSAKTLRHILRKSLDLQAIVYGDQ